MAEAIFAKYSKSTGGGGIIDSSSLISNTTKAGLGLPNSATLDHVIQSLAFRSDTMATVIVTVKDPDGTVVPNANVWMNVPAGAGTNLAYTTDESGTCMFKTNAGTANFSDHAYDNYIDVNSQSNVRVDCPVGSVKSITLQRTKCFNNGASVGYFTGSQWLNFSPFAGTVDITCDGGGGQGGACSTIVRSSDGADRLEKSQFSFDGFLNFKVGSWSNHYLTDFAWYKGPTRMGTYVDDIFLLPNNVRVNLNSVARIRNGNNKNLVIASLPGCNGAPGKRTVKAGVNVCNKNGFVSAGSGRESNPTLNINLFYSTQNNGLVMINYYGHYFNQNQTRINTLNLREGGADHEPLVELSNATIKGFRRNNGRTGASATLFGVSAAGGAGGYTIPSIFGPRDAIYNAGLSNTGARGGVNSTIIGNFSAMMIRNWSVSNFGDENRSTYFEYANIWSNLQISYEAGSSGHSSSVIVDNIQYCK